MTDEQIIKALDCCGKEELGHFCSICPKFDRDNDFCQEELHNEALDLINRQKAENAELQLKINELEIELKAMRGAANSYKSIAKTLEMDNAQLHSDIINANQNFDHINGLWEAEKEKVEKAKQKVINVCKQLQAAKAEIERLEAQHREMCIEMKVIKRTAIKEFVEKLKPMYEVLCVDEGDWCFEIDRRVKEMVGEENAKCKMHNAEL